jgi:hypothetical protein
MKIVHTWFKSSQISSFSKKYGEKKMSDPNIEANLTTVHPAIDFTSSHAYVGQKIHSRNFPGRSKILYIITDNRSIMEFRDITSEIRNIRLLYIDFNMEQRWSWEGIEAFVNNEEPIEPAQLFSRIRELFKSYIELADQRLYDFLTLWSIGTYFYWIFNTYPYVYVGGISGSGKTKLLTLCSSICFNSISGADVSSACLFRLIQSSKCSVFIDESEVLSNIYGRSDFRALLLSGYKKGLKVYRNRRTADGNFEPESFELYSPKMLVNIEGLESVLGSRCIDIIMQRGSNRNITAREVVIDYPIWQQIRDMIYPFLMKNWKAVKQKYVELQNDDTLHNRDWELWKPILSLAQFFDNVTLFKDIRALAIEKAAESQSTSSNIYELVLAETLLSLVDHDDFYRLADIKCEMVSKLEDHDYLSSRQVGNLLRRMGFIKSRRMGSGYQYFIEVSKIQALARNLGISGVSEHSELSEGTGGQGAQNNQG